MHLEEDTGKSLHVGGATGRIHGATHSLVDYNRAGIPLVEIVTEPEIRSAGGGPRLRRGAARAHASRWASRTRVWSRGRCVATRTSRCAGAGESRLGTRSETKNLNSLRSVERAVRYEISRQAARLDAGGRVVQETRHYDEGTGTTSAGRTKEESTDYRYFPEPDLTPLALSADYVAAVRFDLPELPAQRRARMAEKFGFSPLDLEQMRNGGVLDRVEETIAAGAPPAEARAWWLNDLARRAAEAGREPAELAITGP